MPPSICQICSVEFTYNQFLRPLCFSLSSEGYEVHVAFNQPSKLSEIDCCSGRIKFHHVEVSRSSSPLALLRAFCSFYMLFKEHQFSAIHCHTPSAALSARLAALFARIPLTFYTAHGFYFHENMPFWKYWFHVALEWLLSKITKFIFTQSLEDAQIATRFKFLPSNRIACIGNGVSEKRFMPKSGQEKEEARLEYFSSSNIVVLGIVARRVKEKGYLPFFEALKSLFPVYPSLRVLLVGSRLESDYSSSIESELQDLISCFPGRIYDCGYLSEVEHAYSAMDIFCLPSFREGVPRSLIEAMMSGLPCVASNIRGCRELIDHNKNGLLVMPGSSFELSVAIESLIRDSQLRALISSEAQAKAFAECRESDVIARQLVVFNRYLHSACL